MANFPKKLVLTESLYFQNNNIVSKPLVKFLEEYPSKKFSLRLKPEAVIQSCSAKRKNLQCLQENTSVDVSFSIK